MSEEKLTQIEYIIKALPPRFSGVKPDHKMLARLKEKGGIGLIGGVGTGKTFQMLCVMVAHIEEEMKYMSEQFGAEPVQEKTIRKHFLSVPDILRQIKDEFDSPDAPRIMDSLMSRKILFLDDLGAEKASDWVKEQLYVVINERYNWQKPIMFTSNLEMKEIAEHYGDRFASRLAEMCEIEKLRGEDRRMKK